MKGVTRREKQRETRGGVLFTTNPDIVPELVRFTEGELRGLVKQPQAIIVELIATPSDVLTNPCAISSVLLKIVAIDSAIFDGHFIEDTPIKEFQNEVHIHQDSCKRSVTRFGCSIAPTILYADVYTKEELMKVFPNIGQYVKGTVGLIFMERITHNPTLENPTLHEYLKYRRDVTLLEKARRLFVMLAELGFFHNDFHLKNVVVTQPLHGSSPALLLIDFGRASVIPPVELAKFQRKVEVYDTSPTDDLRQEILTFLYRIEYKGYNPDHYPDSYGWFKGDIANEVEVTAPILLDDIKKKNCVLFKKIDYVTRELKRNGHLLKYYPLEKRSDRVLVLYAVANFGEALEYASEALRGDKEVVMTAVLQSTMALEFASRDMRADKDVLRIALRDLRNPRVLQYAVDLDKKIVMPYIRRDGLALKYIDMRIQDKEMVMAAVSQNGMALEYAVIKDREIVMTAVRQNGRALHYAGAWSEDEEVVLTAVLQNGYAIHFTLNRNPKLLLYASVNGHRATEDEIKRILPFLDTYVPSEEDKQLLASFKENVAKKSNKMSTVETFRTLYEREISEELRRREQIQERTSESLERLSECRKGNCSISGGKNKKVMYGTRRKSRHTRTKSRRA
jgi:hypothetical protein